VALRYKKQGVIGKFHVVTTNLCGHEVTLLRLLAKIERRQEFFEKRFAL
jgi:hypothetical protein